MPGIGSLPIYLPPISSVEEDLHVEEEDDWHQKDDQQEGFGIALYHLLPFGDLKCRELV